MSTQGDLPWGADPGDGSSERPPTYGSAAESWPPGQVVEEPFEEDAPAPEELPPPPPPRKAAAKKSTRAPAKKQPAKKQPAKRAPAAKTVARTAAARPVEEPELVPPVAEPAPLDILPGPVVATERHRPSRAGTVVYVLLSVILALAAGFAAAAWNESKPHVYESSATLLIDQGAALTYARDDGLVGKLGALRFKYADEVTTTTFAAVVGPKAGVHPGLAHAALSAQVPIRSLLLRVTARASDQALPQRIAQAAAQQLSADLDAEQRLQGVARKNRVTLTVVSPAQPARHTAPSRRRSEQLAVGAFGGFLLAAAILRDLTRRRSWPAGPGA